MDALVDRLPTVRDGPSLRDGVLARIRSVLAAPEITENTPLADAVPDERRREMWRALRREFPRCLPILETTIWVGVIVGILGGVALVVAGVASGAFWGGMVAAGLSGLLSVPFGTKLPRKMTRVKDLVDWVLRTPQVAKGDETLWTRAQIAEVVLAVARSELKAHGLTEATTFAEPVAMR